MNIPNVVMKAIQDDIRRQWAMCDALLRECPEGPIKRVAQELRRECGEDYTHDTLRRMRMTARNFPVGVRVATVPWQIHNEAGTIENLRDMIATGWVKVPS